MTKNRVVLIGAVLVAAAAPSGLVGTVEAGTLPDILHVVAVAPDQVLKDQDMSTIRGGLAAAASAVGTGAGTDTASASILVRSSVGGGTANASGIASGAATGTVAASASGNASIAGRESASAGVAAGSSISGGIPSTYVSIYTAGR